MRGSLFQSTGTGYRRRLAFTLMELLVVLGIIALLAALLLPALSSAHYQANTLVCASRLRQINLAMLNYATDYGGRFPPYYSMAGSKQWYDKTVLGRYMRVQTRGTLGDIGGPALTCPEDRDAWRSYAVNMWCASLIPGNFLNPKPPLTVQGEQWDAGVRDASRMLLVAEAWTGFGGPSVFYPNAYIGYRGPTAGQRFGGGGGLAAHSVGRYQGVNAELPFMRHRRRVDGGVGIQAKGRVNLGFADGHVELLRQTDLADFETGRLTGAAYWSPMDKAAPDVEVAAVSVNP